MSVFESESGLRVDELRLKVVDVGAIDRQLPEAPP